MRVDFYTGDFFGAGRRKDFGMDSENMRAETRLLLEWYAGNGRKLPWRVRGGAHPDPYAVWVSEIMLQQTTVQTVLAYFGRWMEQFPTLEALAETSLDDVLRVWQGLGYYARARKMHECARTLVRDFQGRFPRDRTALLKLPGIGPYTASSICAFAFDKPETVVDGNVIRVIARLRGIETEVDRESITPLAAELTPEKSAADYASAIMDLGAVVCKPATPSCLLCPWRKCCAACAKGIQEKIPVLRKIEKKHKDGAVFVITDPAGALFLRRRPGKGLLSGLWELPWSEDGTPPFSGEWREKPCEVRHVFTHFSLTLRFLQLLSPCPAEFAAQGRFVPDDRLGEYPLSTLMRKVLRQLGRQI